MSTRREAEFEGAWDSEVEPRFRDLVRRGWYTNNGPLLREFESALAREVGVEHCVCTCTIETAFLLLVCNLDPERTCFGVDPQASPYLGGALDLVGWPWQDNRFWAPPPHAWRVVAPQSDSWRDLTGAAGGAHDPKRVLVDLSNVQSLDEMRKVFREYQGCSGLLSFGGGGLFDMWSGGALLTDRLDLANLLRTARNHHGEQTFVDASVRFNAKMSEAQALMGLLALERIAHGHRGP
jgi:hypothetical protein